MNDDYLYQFREAPNARFTEDLYQRLESQGTERPLLAQWLESVGAQQRNHLRTAFVIVLLIAALALSPAVRSYAQEILTSIGHVLISDEPTYAEQFENRLQSGRVPTAAPSAEPEVVDWQAPTLLSLSEASALSGFPIQVPSFVPPGYNLLWRSVEPPTDKQVETRVTTAWQSPEGALTLSQTFWPEDAEAHLLPIGDAPLKTVTVQGVEGMWIEELRLSTHVENDTVVPAYANLLIWEKDGFEFWLQSSAQLPLADMLAIANSIQP